MSGVALQRSTTLYPFYIHALVCHHLALCSVLTSTLSIAE
jgi:hypothetical protein